MSTVDVAALREAAEGATPGPWQVDLTDGADYVFDVATGGFCFVPDHNCQKPVENAAYIAAANPTTILALLDRLEAAEAAVERGAGDCGRVDSNAGSRSGPTCATSAPRWMVADERA